MDWRYVGFGLEQGVPGLMTVASTLLVLVLAAQNGRRVVACAPGFMAIAVFIVGCVLAGLGPAHDAWAYVLLTAFAVVPFLFKSSVLALRQPLVGVVHIATLVGTVYLWFVGTLVLVRDTL